MTFRIRGLRSDRRARTLLRFARAASRRLKVAGRPWEVQVRFVRDREIRALHRRFFGDPRPTDVITFTYDPRAGRQAGEAAAPFGDIVISLDAARRQARAGGHPILQELALLLVHGILHLLGHDDRSPALRRKMFAAQTRLFRSVAPRLAPPDFA